MTDLAKLVVRLEAQTAQYQKELERAQTKLNKFNQGAAGLARSIGKGLALAGTAAAAGLAYLTKSAIDSQDRFAKMSQTIGVSTEALSELEYAAGLSGSNLEELEKGLLRLSRNASDAAKGLATPVEAFEKLGISAVKNDGTLKNTEDLLLEVADAFTGLENGTAKAAVAQELFGRSGAKLIPLLNNGAAGIAALRGEAAKFGKTVDSESAKAAEKFNDNLTRLKTASSGVVNQFTSAMLPTLVALTDEFVKSAKNSAALEFAVKALSVGFKSLVTAGVIVTGVFDSLGKIIYGVGAAVVRIAQGEFKLAFEEIKSQAQSASSSVTDDLEFISKIWSDQVPQMEENAKKTGDALDEIKFEPKGVSDGVDSALASLQKFQDALRQQIDTFGMSEEAVLNYRITQGDLSKEWEKAGAAGQPLIATIMSLSNELAGLNEEAARAEEIKNAASALGDFTAGLQEQLDTLGLTGQALLEYRLNLGDLSKDLKALGPEAAETYKNAILELNAALEENQKQLDKQNELEAEAARVTESVLTPLQKYQQEVEKLNELLDANKITQETYNKAIEQAQKILDDTSKIGETFAEQAARNSQDIFADYLYDPFSKGLDGMVEQFGDMLRRLAAQALAADIGGAIFGSSGGGSGGGFFGAAAGFLGGLFGGTMDSGGRGTPGKAYLIGTGAQPEMFVPDSPGRFIPNAGGGGDITVHQTFILQSPDGRPPSRLTQSQIATSAAQGLRKAQIRNG